MRGVKFLSRLGMVLLSSLLLIGCGEESQSAYEWNEKEVSASSGVTGEGEAQAALKEEAEIPKEPTVANPGDTEGKEIVTLGVTFQVQDALREKVDEYNAQSEEYYIQILVYEREIVSQYKMDLLLGKGTDIYELGDMSMEQLAHLGVLEDLSPYFKRSHELTEGFLLPCVKNAGTVDGKLVGIAPEFYLLALVTQEGVARNGAWTVEDFLDLQKDYPISRLTDYDEHPVGIFLNVLSCDVNNRIDWTEKNCDFSSDSFRQILESLYKNSKRLCKEQTAENLAEQLYKEEKMVQNVTISSPWAYAEVMEAFEGFGEIVGFPSESEKPVYQLYANNMLGINSASDCKEGAWDFLEYWLSEEVQYKTGNFPARRDVFEKMLSEDASPRDTQKGYVEELCSRINFYTGEKHYGFLRIDKEDRRALRYMVENAHYVNAMRQSFIQGVLFEELQAYFAGDKSVEAVMDIIQNRIALYLSEQK